MSLKFIAYIRVSTKEQGDSRNGMEAQRASLEHFAKFAGGEIVKVYEEVSSGKNDLSHRPQLAAAFEDCRNRPNTYLLVGKLDRLSRDLAFVANLLKDTSINFVTVEDGMNADRMVLGMKAVFADKERRLISERTRAALQAKKARGEYAGGGVNSNHDLGVQRSAEVNSRNADLFAERLRGPVLRMRGHGMTVNQIAEELNSLGVKTARGGKWYAATVCNVLRRLEGEITRIA